MAAAPTPTKPPRGIKYGKDEAGCGFLVNVIKSLGFSETNEERQKEKQRIEKEFKRSDQRLNALVSRHDQQLSQVIPLFTEVTNEIAISRERIHAVKENLSACKRLLQCRRDELKKMWTDALQHKHLLSMLEQINDLRKVPQNVVNHTTKRQYLHASKALTEALTLINGPLKEVEGLLDLRSDLMTRRQHLYQHLLNELGHYLYQYPASDVWSVFQRSNSNRLKINNNSGKFNRDTIIRRSTDRIEASAKVRQALKEMAQGVDITKATMIENTDLLDRELSTTYFIAIIVECFGMLGKVPDAMEKLRLNIQNELQEVVKYTTKQLIEEETTMSNNMNSTITNIEVYNSDGQYQHSILKLIDMIFKQFKAIVKAHTILLKNSLAIVQKYQVSGPQHYDVSDFWSQAQIVLQLLLTDYLDIQNATGSAADEVGQPSFTEHNNNINAFFQRRKIPITKKSFFKFEKSSNLQNSHNSNKNNNSNNSNNNNLHANTICGQDSQKKEHHRRNASDVSSDNIHLTPTSSGVVRSSGSSNTNETGGSFNMKLQQLNKYNDSNKLLICKPDPNIITRIYLPLMSYIQEIEGFMKCKPGQFCNLHEFLDNYIRETFLLKGHNSNLQNTLETLSKNQDMWRTIISPEEIKHLHLARPILQSTGAMERCLADTKQLIQDLPCYSEELLKCVCSLLKDYREICQMAYRSIVQPDGEEKRIYSVTWLKDEDISRFLKTLPNWTDLKSSKHRSKQNGTKKLQRQTFDASEEESPLQVQQRNIREAEMLTSNLGEGGISQQEILADVNILRELAVLQESMEWFSGRISEFATELRRPLVNDSTTILDCATISTVKDGTIKVLTNLALEFDELANTCLLVLHLEVRVQCFHYLRTNPRSPQRKDATDRYIDSKDDILEPDRQVQVLTKRLTEMDEAFSVTLHPRKTRYIFEGLAHLTSRILIQASNYLEHIDQIIVQRMCRNALALQQTLSNITASREVALDQAKQFYEMLCMEPDVILTTLVEQGSQFTEMQYLNALQLSCKALGITDSNTLANYQQKLSDILGTKPSTGIVV